MPKEIIKYTKGNVTVVWQPKLCTHSTICWKGLGEVFNPRVRPWVNMEGSSEERIIEQVRKCPSGALSIAALEEPTPLNTTATETTEIEIQIAPNGPLIINSPCVLKHADGRIEKKTKTVLCRCGASENKPFCDGSHSVINFRG